MKLFILEDNKVILNKDEVLLVSEFARLWDAGRNKMDGDVRGSERKRAFREFTYIYLRYDWESPYKNFSELERHEVALSDSELTQKQLEDELFIAACKKYQAMQDTPQLKLLNSAYRMCDELRLFYTVADLQERDGDGKFILNANQAITSLANLGKMVKGLDELEQVVKKQKQGQDGNGVRGDAEPGMFDGKHRGL